MYKRKTSKNINTKLYGVSRKFNGLAGAMYLHGSNNLSSFYFIRLFKLKHLFNTFFPNVLCNRIYHNVLTADDIRSTNGFSKILGLEDQK